MRLKDFNETFSEQLRDPEYVRFFLEECLNDGLDNFLIGLRDVVKANGGFGQVASDLSLNRESLYKSLSSDGNPAFKTVQAVLDEVGIRLAFQPKDPLIAA